MSNQRDSRPDPIEELKDLLNPPNLPPVPPDVKKRIDAGLRKKGIPTPPSPNEESSRNDPPQD